MKTLEKKFNPALKGLIILFCLMSNTILSQDPNNLDPTIDNNSKGIFSLGLKAGPNYSTFADTYHHYESEGIVGFHIGAVTKYKLTDLFSIQPEVVYSKQGATLINPNGLEFKNKIDYLNIPVLACYEVIEGLEIQAGPQLGFVITIWDEDFDLIDYGITGGAQYTLPMNLFFQARYYLGLNDIGYGYNRVGNISVGYLFDF